MNPQQIELLARLQQFPLDDADDPFPFTARLAAENGWSAAYARRAVQEYRRFLFLGAAAGHPVSPSDEVDQVWHLHLTYTRSYWDDLCGRVLGRPFHHEPTRGGEREHAKFVDWYARTLASYRRLFGEEPPRDLWPAPEDRWRDGRRFQRVDVAGWFRLPRPRLGGRALSAASGASGVLALLFAGGCVAGAGGGLGPLDLPGPQFLSFYLFATGAIMAAATWVRWRARGPAAVPGAAPPELDPYEAAYLSGGPERAVDAAIVGLVDKGAAALDPTTGHLICMRVPESAESQHEEAPYRRAAPRVDPLHPLERAVYDVLRSNFRPRIPELRKEALAAADAVAARLIRAGLILDEDADNRARLLGVLVAMTAPALGFVKFILGSMRGKPVGFLVMLVIISFIVALFVFGRRVLRSRAGDAALAGLKVKHGDLGQQHRNLHGTEAVMGFGIFGAAALAGGSLDPLMRYTADRTGGSGCGGGGGSSCGGDSGGGGGCGGCGGGGGD